jgi:hypothetical protein
MTTLHNKLPLDEFAPVSVASAQALAQSMDESGIGVLHDIVPDAILAKLRNTVAAPIE